MSQRRKSYRLPQVRYEELKEKLEKKNMDFDEFLQASIDLYLEGEIDPKGDTESWGQWMKE